jgi:hypothetical protein
MTGPQEGDLLIRDAAGVDEAFVVADVRSRATLEGPFSSLVDAALAARRLSPHGVIWRETTDGRGRSLGEPYALPINSLSRDPAPEKPQ